MIKKILKIKGVGRFKSFDTRNDDMTFVETTIIFGYNTYGKSTLTSIFRSLRDNNPHYIYGRKTFGLSCSQEIEILDASNKKFIFNSNWEDKNIEIFDNDFISKNVFYGDSINKEQQSSLYCILIGDDIYQLKQKIDRTKEEQSKLEKEKEDIKKKFEKKALDTFNSFLNLAKENDVNGKIEEIQSQIKQQENLDSLKMLVSKTPLKSIFGNFKAEFLKVLDLSIEETINKHIEKNWKNTAASKDFLNCGLSLLKEGGGCVFCGQDLTRVSDFIGDLRRVFSNEYKNLKESINRFGRDFISIDLEKIFLEFEKYGLNLRNKLDYEKLLLAKKNIDKKVVEKQNNLNLKLNFDTDNDFIDFLKELGKLSDIFNDIVIQPYGGISKLTSLKNELEKYELTKYRFSNESLSIIDEYNQAQDQLELKKNEIKRLNTELAREVDNIFKKHEKQINYFLKKLGANFTLKDLSPQSHMGRVNTHFCDFHFVFDDSHMVPVSNKRKKDELEPENIPHFKNTLSDSDKRVLAFSFYLAKLSNDDDLKNKIIVLDDPFSSFDENRKEETINLLNDLKNKNDDNPKQKIILTHDRGFLCRLFNKLSDKSKILKICYSSENGSTLEACDVENDFIKDTYFKDMEYIKNSVEETINVDEALKKARPCLEHILKRKYYFSLSAETLKKQSIRKYLDEIGNLCLKKDEVLAESWHEDMHDQHPIMKLNEPAKVAKLRRFLELIKEI